MYEKQSIAESRHEDADSDSFGCNTPEQKAVVFNDGAPGKQTPLKIAAKECGTAQQSASNEAAMKSVLHGNRWVSDEAHDCVVADLLCTECIRSPRFKLTPTESKIAMWFVKGFSYQDIAQVRGVQTETIKFHIRNILVKTDCSNRVQLIFLVLCLNHQ